MILSNIKKILSLVSKAFLKTLKSFSPSWTGGLKFLKNNLNFVLRQYFGHPKEKFCD